MRVAVTYKGVFNIRYQNVYGADSRIMDSISSTIKNHDEMLGPWVASNEVDYFFSTYETDEKIDSIYKEKYKPKYYGFVNPPSRTGHHTFLCQLLHHKNLINEIRNEEEKNGLYDMFVFARPDAVFSVPAVDMNIDLDKFNITQKSKSDSGNCDDNFWVFSRKYFDAFSNTVDTLWNRGMITHGINHVLSEFGVPINYIFGDEDHKNNSTYGHNIFTLVRLGEKSLIFDFNTLVNSWKSNRNEVKNLLEVIREDQHGFQVHAGVVSSLGREETEVILSDLDLRQHLKFVVTKEDYGVGKEELNCYNRATSVVQVKPNRCIIVGGNSDSISPALLSMVPNRHIWEVDGSQDITLDNYNKFIAEQFDPWS